MNKSIKVFPKGADETVGRVVVVDDPDIEFRICINQSGIQPTEYKVLIDPKPVEQKIGSIIVPVSTQESEKYAQIEGRIVAASPLAFSYASKEEWEAAGARKPGPGDVVLYAKYAGVRVKGKDGKEYVIANDKDIIATIEE